MKTKRFLRDSLIALFVFLGLQTFQTMLLSRALGEQEKIMAYRLESAVGGLFSKAHKAKDDLSSYEVIRSLAQSPGIVQARILAPFEHLDFQSGSESYPFALRDDSGVWGTLVLGISDRLQKSLLHQQWLLGMSAWSIVWVFLFRYLRWLETKNLNLRQRAAELSGALQNVNLKLHSSEEREAASILRSSASLRKAVQQLSAPTIVLDAQQRIVALNNNALKYVGCDTVEKAISKSWFEIPQMAASAVSLQQSLVSPAQVVKCPLPGSEEQLCFLTENCSLTGTWISVI